jgi:hypothetical protein
MILIASYNGVGLAQIGQLYDFLYESVSGKVPSEHFPAKHQSSDALSQWPGAPTRYPPHTIDAERGSFADAALRGRVGPCGRIAAASSS